MQCNSKGILTISPEQMLYEITSEDIILITTVRFLEVIEQLSRQKELNDNECYLLTLLRIEEYDRERLKIKLPKSLATCREQKIPKTIHYCWFGKKEIPYRYRTWMESWSRFCPDYEIIQWNEQNYDIHKNKFISQAYEQGKWAFVSDYVRLDIIHEYGGVYLDTDVELLKNIDEMLMNDGFCGFESRQYVAYGLGFGSPKHNEIVNAIKEYYESTCFVLDDGTLNQINCPIIQTEIMKGYGLICNGKFQIVNGMAVYPSRILCGMSPHSFRLERNPAAYAIHHYAASWVSDMQRDSKQAVICFIKQQGENADYYYIK